MAIVTIEQAILNYDFPDELKEIKRLVIDDIDITKIILWGGYAVSRNDIDGQNAGMTDDGISHRDFLRFRFKVELKFIPLNIYQTYFIEHTILRSKEWHNVIFNDFGIERLEKMYQSSFAGTYTSVLPNMRVGAALNLIGE